MEKEHEELYIKLNSLLEGVKEEKSYNDLEPLISSLEEYSIIHFSNEEKSLLENNYEFQAMLKIQNKLFHQYLTNFKGKLNSNEKDPRLYKEIDGRLSAWWKLHLLHEDKTMSEFLNSQKIS